MTKGQIAAFYMRLEASIRSNGYDSIKDYLNKGTMGITYPTYMSKKSIGRIPTARCIDKVANDLGVSTDYLLYGKGVKNDKTAPAIADDELDFITAYRNADKSTKLAIKALLNKHNA